MEQASYIHTCIHYILQSLTSRHLYFSMKITKLWNRPEFSYYCPAHFLLLPRKSFVLILCFSAKKIFNQDHVSSTIQASDVNNPHKPQDFWNLSTKVGGVAISQFGDFHCHWMLSHGHGQLTINVCYTVCPLSFCGGHQQDWHQLCILDKHPDGL